MKFLRRSLLFLISFSCVLGVIVGSVFVLNGKTAIIESISVGDKLSVFYRIYTPLTAAILGLFVFGFLLIPVCLFLRCFSLSAEIFSVILCGAEINTILLMLVSAAAEIAAAMIVSGPSFCFSLSLSDDRNGAFLSRFTAYLCSLSASVPFAVIAPIADRFLPR